MARTASASKKLKAKKSVKVKARVKAKIAPKAKSTKKAIAKPAKAITKKAKGKPTKASKTVKPKSAKKSSIKKNPKGVFTLYMYDKLGWLRKQAKLRGLKVNTMVIEAVNEYVANHPAATNLPSDNLLAGIKRLLSDDDTGQD